MSFIVANMLFYHVPKISEVNLKGLLHRAEKDMNVCYFLSMCCKFHLNRNDQNRYFKVSYSRKIT